MSDWEVVAYVYDCSVLLKFIQLKLFKAEMSKKGLTLMGLLFTGNAATGNDRLFSQENSISLDLSLQINRKLQCVLEDILLKNIMMKVRA